VTANATKVRPDKSDRIFIVAYYTSWPDTTVPGTAGDLRTNPVSFSPRSKFSVTARFHAYIPDGKGELVFRSHC